MNALVEQVCSVCDGPARRVKASGKNLYDVDCAQCGSYRTARGTEIMTRRNDAEYRRRLASHIHDVNAHGLRCDLIGGSGQSLRFFRIEPDAKMALALIEEPNLHGELEWRAKQITAGRIDRDEPFNVSVPDPNRDEAIAMLTQWWESVSSR